MSNLSSAKMYGGIGALLTLIGPFIPSVGLIASIIGMVLIFIAVKYIADETKDHPIFKNYLLYFICGILAVVLPIVIIFYSVGGLSFFSNLTSMDYSDPSAFVDFAGPLITGCLVSLVIMWILLIIGTLFLRKSYNRIAEHTNVGLFKTTGLVYFIGAITTIIVIGIFIMVIAKILEIIAFFSLPDKIPSKGASTDSGRRCPNCGRSIPEDARACPYCAKRFEDYL